VLSIIDRRSLGEGGTRDRGFFLFFRSGGFNSLQQPSQAFGFAAPRFFVWQRWNHRPVFPNHRQTAVSIPHAERLKK
jgi:hypothetical protein